jgi:hypothetical protein
MFNNEGIKVLAIFISLLLLVGILIWDVWGNQYQITPTTTISEGSLIVNEVMTSNKTTFTDEDGDYPDWLEILNTGSSPVNLSGYSLSDRAEKPGKWVFPDVVLEPGEYLIVFASGKNRRDETNGYLHTNFRLKADGEIVRLYDPQGNTVDQVEIGNMPSDVAWARNPENISEWQKMTEATPGFPNNEEGRAAFLESRKLDNSTIFITEVMTSNRTTLADEDGDFSDWIEIYNKGDEPFDLSGCGLSDDPNDLLQWRFPDVILGPGEYVLVFASGKDRWDAETNSFHTNFRLNSVEETVILSNAKGQILDQITVKEVPSDVSFGRSEEEWETWITFQTPSPGYPNNEEGQQSFQEEAMLPSSPIIINEIMASNQTDITDEDGDHMDWIELYNQSDKPLALKDYALSDSTKNLVKWRFPDVTLDPGQFLLVFASGKDRRDPEGEYLHTNFKLSFAGETLTLADSSGNLLDKLILDQIPVNLSYGRQAGKNGFFFFEKSTPGEANAGGYPGFSEEPHFSVAGGIHSNEITLTLEGPPHASIRYTLDGSVPTLNSQEYSAPISIKKTTVVRARTFQDGLLASSTAIHTYIINENHVLPVVSVSTDPKNLWDWKTGIYVMGDGANPEFPHKGANFWQDWEKPIHIEYYDEKGNLGFSQDAGIKVFGAYSRAMPQKSLAVFARKEYGKERIVYPLFPDKPELDTFHSIVLRTSGQDAELTKIRDAMMTRLIRDTGVDYQAYRPVVVYLNGEYWGIYNIREKINKYFLAYNHGIENPDNIDIIEANRNVKAGSADHYDALIEFVKSHDMKDPKNYEYVKTQMDVENYMDYQIAQMYFANTDNGNIRFWRERSPKGKWRWILYDTDWGFFNVDHDTVWHIINPKGTGVGKMFSNILIRKLLENKEFKEEFIRRFAYHLSHTFTTERVLATIDEMAKKIEPEMPRDKERWGGSMESWERQLNRLRDFAKERPAKLFKYIDQHFRLTQEQKEMFKIH